MRLFLVAGAMALLGGGAAQAEDWRLVVLDIEELNSIDADAVRASGTKRVFPVLNMPTVSQSDDWAYSLTQWEIDCEARTLQYLSGSAFKADGALFQRHVGGPGPVETIVASTGGEVWIRAVCERVWPYPGGRASLTEEVAVQSGIRERAR